MNETGLCTIEQFPSACTWKSAYCVMAHLSYTKLPSTIPNMVLVYYSGLWYNAINSHYHQKIKASSQGPMQKLPAQQKRAFWLRQLYLWHWISSAGCLVGMLLFAVTGLTLNNASHIEAKPIVKKSTIVLPSSLLTYLQAQPVSNKASLPHAVADWLMGSMDIDAADKTAEWSAEEVYVSLPRPGGDAWLSINRESGEMDYEITNRGWISYLNDLHKGRNTGTAWSWFLDVFSSMALVFSLTGLCLLYMHSANRPSTWPLVGIGVVIPLVLAILFIH